MHISIIVAIARNGVIGIGNRLPWHLPADLKHFKSITLGKPVLMGQNTFESIGKPLPGRKNIVLTRDPDFRPEGCEVVYSLDEAFRAAADADECMVIGGAEVYRSTLDRADRLYITWIHADIEGDAHFPEVSEDVWEEISRENIDPNEKNPHPYSFTIYERK